MVCLILKECGSRVPLSYDRILCDVPCRYDDIIHRSCDVRIYIIVPTLQWGWYTEEESDDLADVEPHPQHWFAQVTTADLFVNINNVDTVCDAITIIWFS